MVMERIKRQGKSDEKLATNVLLWVAQARRPLSVVELQHALAVFPGMKQMDTDYVTDEDLLISVCAGLVIVDKEECIVSFVRKWEIIKCGTMRADSEQTIQHSSTSDTGDNFCFRTAKKPLPERASHTSHLTPFGMVSADPVQK
jgi:hypothetical protein